MVGECAGQSCSWQLEAKAGRGRGRSQHVLQKSVPIDLTFPLDLPNNTGIGGQTSDLP